jgi:hypothetical protein
LTAPYPIPPYPIAPILSPRMKVISVTISDGPLTVV